MPFNSPSATPRHTRDSMHNQHLMRIIRITLNSEDIQLDPYEKSVGDAELNPSIKIYRKNTDRIFRKTLWKTPAIIRFYACSICLSVLFYLNQCYLQN